MNGFTPIDLPNATVYLAPHFLPEIEANLLFEVLRESIGWQQHSIKLFGKTLPQPRLVAWLGDEGLRYTYSGLTLKATGWLSPVLEVKTGIEQATGYKFNSVLANYYRDGQDSMGWHADDEPELAPEIASLSLGASRQFKFRSKTPPFLTRSMVLTHGSLLIMSGQTQHHYKHALPKTKSTILPRINLTFRRIITAG